MQTQTFYSSFSTAQCPSRSNIRARLCWWLYDAPCSSVGWYVCRAMERRKKILFLQCASLAYEKKISSIAKIFFLEQFSWKINVGNESFELSNFWKKFLLLQISIFFILHVSAGLVGMEKYFYWGLFFAFGGSCRWCFSDYCICYQKFQSISAAVNVNSLKKNVFSIKIQEMNEFYAPNYVSCTKKIALVSRVLGNYRAQSIFLFFYWQSNSCLRQ